MEKCKKKKKKNTETDNYDININVKEQGYACLKWLIMIVWGISNFVSTDVKERPLLQNK